MRNSEYDSRQDIETASLFELIKLRHAENPATVKHFRMSSALRSSSGSQSTFEDATDLPRYLCHLILLVNTISWEAIVLFTPLYQFVLSPLTLC